MESKKVAVIMPTYNNEEYLAEAIESVLRQSYKNWRLVVINDGSTDGTEQILEFYRDKYKNISTIHSILNEGIAMSRNKGIWLLDDVDYIAVADADDLLHPDRLKKQVALLEKSKVDFVYSSYYTANEEAVIENNQWVLPKNKLTYKGVIDGYTAPHVTIMAKARCIKDNPYRNELRVNDDMALVLDWLKAGYTYKRIKQPLMIVRYHMQSVSKLKDKEVKKSIEELKKEFL